MSPSFESREYVEKFGLLNLNTMGQVITFFGGVCHMLYSFIPTLWGIFWIGWYHSEIVIFHDFTVLK